MFQFQLLDDFTRKQIEIKEEAEPVSDNEPEDKPSEDEEEVEEEDPLPGHLTNSILFPERNDCVKG